MQISSHQLALYLKGQYECILIRFQSNENLFCGCQGQLVGGPHSLTMINIEAGAHTAPLQFISPHKLKQVSSSRHYFKHVAKYRCS